MVTAHATVDIADLKSRHPLGDAVEGRRGRAAGQGPGQAGGLPLS